MEKPSLPKGTRDFGPQVMARRLYLISAIRSVFEKYGFQPIETPALEHLSTLLGKYGEEGDQLLFRILNSGNFLKDAPHELLAAADYRKLSGFISEKGLRYDLTVPFARYVVMNRNEVAMPFRRYQIQPVWRADRPQKGRYREFYQCDADVVGTDSLLCEAEIVMMINEVFSKLGIEQYSIKINHRNLLNRLALETGAGNRETDLFVALDKLDKIGRNGVLKELAARGFAPGTGNRLFGFIDASSQPDGLQQLQKLFPDCRGIDELNRILELLNLAGELTEKVQFDLSLARGLTYYTGCIFEVKIYNVAVGSVCGGGRYDNLTQAFGSKEKLSGVGISFGIDRLYDALEELRLFPEAARTTARVLVCHFDEATFKHGLKLVCDLRRQGVASELYPEITRLKKQLDYANKKTIPFVAVLGPEEISRNVVTLKNMATRVQEQIAITELAEKLKW